MTVAAVLLRFFLAYVRPFLTVEVVAVIDASTTVITSTRKTPSLGTVQVPNESKKY